MTQRLNFLLLLPLLFVAFMFVRAITETKWARDVDTCQLTLTDEQAEMLVTHTENMLALKPQVKRGWKTYNFEVAHYHTYVAGGFRVHNDSLYAPVTREGALADNISGQISDFAFGKNTLASALAGSAIRAVASTAVDTLMGRAVFNSQHLTGRYIYDVAGGLGSLGGNLLMQDLISGLGIRGPAANDNGPRMRKMA